MSTKPSIVPTENGPLKVTNCRVLKGSLDGKVYQSSGKVFLCRCGASRNKPFCDGSHTKSGFSDAKDPNAVPDRRDEYVGAGITVFDNRGICSHSAKCTESLKSVFRPGREPWIDLEGVDAAKIAETVSRCPSGALSYSIDGVEHRDEESEPMILVEPNGPYTIVGGADLENVEWGVGASRQRFDLCRCGKSQNKPFCSGAHWNHHFDEDAPPSTET